MFFRKSFKSLIISLGAYFFVSLFCFAVSSPCRAENNSYVDISTKLVSDLDVAEYGGSSECDNICKEVITDANRICNQNGQTSEPCKMVKEDQLFFHCLAYDQTGWAAFFDSYMIALDTLAGGACTTACGALLAGNMAIATPAEQACTGFATLDQAAELANGIALNKLLGNNWAGSNAIEQISTALEIAGVVGGAAGMVHF